MPGVDNEDLLDLLKTTQEYVEEGRFTHTQEFQKYDILNKWFQNDREEIQGGDKIKETVQVDEKGTARHVKPMERRSVQGENTLEEIETDFVKADDHYLISRHEMLRNRGEEELIDLVRTKRLAALMGLANLLETRCWDVPTEDNDPYNPLGLKYWLPQMESSAAGMGFYGGRYTGDTGSAQFTDVAGLKPCDSGDNTPSISGGEPRWRHWLAGGANDEHGEIYLDVNQRLIRTMRMSFYKLDFQSPFFAKEMIEGPKSNYRLYCGTGTKVDLEEMLSEQNEGAVASSDLDKTQGVLTFKRVPVLHEPQLDGMDRQPIYFIDHSVFYPYVRAGEYLREDRAQRSMEFPDTFVTWINIEYNFICRNRRVLGVLSQTADNRS